MGVKPETYGTLLSSVMLGKLPQEIRLLLSRGMGGGDRKLDDYCWMSSKHGRELQLVL